MDVKDRLRTSLEDFIDMFINLVIEDQHDVDKTIKKINDATDSLKKITSTTKIKTKKTVDTEKKIKLPTDYSDFPDYFQSISKKIEKSNIKGDKAYNLDSGKVIKKDTAEKTFHKELKYKNEFILFSSKENFFTTDEWQSFERKVEEVSEENETDEDEDNEDDNKLKEKILEILESTEGKMTEALITKELKKQDIQGNIKKQLEKLISENKIIGEKIGKTIRYNIIVEDEIKDYTGKEEEIQVDEEENN